jgi:anti-anti-sigma factor
VCGTTTYYDAAHTVWIVQLRGEHDLRSAARLEREIANVITPGCRLIVDLTDATFVDSSTMNVVLRAHDYVEELGGKMAIASTVGSEPRRVIELLNLPHDMAGYDSTDEALNAVYYATTEHARRSRFSLARRN